MAKFAKGDSVTFVETNQSGVILEVLAPFRGKQAYEVRWINSGDVTEVLESRLEAERKLDNAFDLLKAGIFSAFVDFSRLNTQYKIENTSVNTISSLKASRTIFKPYQYKPLLKFLNSDTRRLLIADEVGLGKTIEAGHIMLEIKARKELNSALIICPKSLISKWKDELEQRFDLAFKAYASKADLVADVEGRRPIFGIISYRNASLSGKNDIGSLFENKSINIDLLICDEAHTMRNQDTDIYYGVRRIIDCSRSVVFMTATPIMMKEDNLFSLMNLLDPDRFRDAQVFKNILNSNKPFIAAISELNARVPFKTIAAHLKDCELRYEYRISEEEGYELQAITVKDDYSDNPLFAKIIKDLETLDENDANRVRIQYDLSSISLLNNIFSRTTKRDVTTDWSQAIRDPKTITVDLSDEEEQLYTDYLEEYCSEKGFDSIEEANPLLLSSIKKTLASSIIAHATNWEGCKRFPKDSKYLELQRIVDDVVRKQGKKIIVFAGQIPTLNYLHYRLGLDHVNSVMIDGSSGIKDRYEVIKHFKSDPNISILLSSEVGGEGLDMQFCDTMVNFDLPWNPMVVEQRIGRIDRFGQQSKFVHIYNILVKGTLQEKIYGRLLNRIGIFKECIGDIEVILDRFLEKNGISGQDNFVSYLEKELESPGVTEEEIERKLESMRKALEQEKFDVDNLSKGLVDSLTNDMYFKEEIGKIQKTGRYITENELIHYVQSIIDNELKTCRFARINDDIFRITVSRSDSKCLTNFMVANQPVSVDANYGIFQNKIRDEFEIDVTFNQEYAFENRDCEYINSYHPFVLAITEYYKKQNQNLGNTFKLSLSQKSISNNTVSSGAYLLGVYLIDIQREILRSIKHSQILVPVLFDCRSGGFIQNADVCDEVFAAVQEKASLCKDNVAYDDAFPLQLAFTERITEIQDKYKEDYSIRAESSKLVLIKRTKSFYERQVSNLERRIRYAEWSNDNNRLKMIPIWKSDLGKLKDKMESELKALDTNKVSINPHKLISLTLLNIN